MNNTKTFITFVLVAAAALSGCRNQNVSAEAGASDRTSITESTVINKAKSVFAGNEMKAAVTVNASALIAETLKEWSHWDDSKTMLFKKFAVNAFDDDLVSMLREATKKDLQNEAARKILKDETGAERYVAASLALASLTPMTGWEVEAMPKNKLQEKQLKGYLRILETFSMTANALFGEIASKMPPSVLQDKEAAKAIIMREFEAIPLEKLKSMVDIAYAEGAKDSRQLDMTGSGNVHWINRVSGDFTGDPKGITWKKNGQVWYGDGSMNGKLYAVGLAEAVGARVDKHKTTTIENTTNSETTSGANVGVK